MLSLAPISRASLCHISSPDKLVLEVTSYTKNIAVAS